MCLWDGNVKQNVFTTGQLFLYKKNLSKYMFSHHILRNLRPRKVTPIKRHLILLNVRLAKSHHHVLVHCGQYVWDKTI